MNNIPIITLDGPSGSGKGTVGRCLAARLGWHFLDSGALYRIVALAAIQASIAPDNVSALCVLAGSLEAVFEDDGRILNQGRDVSVLIRSEACSQMASKIALLPTLREALLVSQRAFCRDPGLVADGRDMGTVVFPKAPFKFFLEASLEQRVVRRDRQLKETGQNVSLEDLRRQMVLRDERDSARASSPLKPAKDAVVIDTTAWGVEAVCEQIIGITQVSTKFS